MSNASDLSSAALQWQALDWHQRELDCLRLDLIDPLISGNKSFKLALNLKAAKAQGFERIVSFGGAYSNHIHALAAAGQTAGIKTTGVIRGQEHYAQNPCLSDAINMGMELHFVDRKTYAKRYQADYWQQLSELFGPSYIVPEGGANHLGAKGCEQIAQAINNRYQTCENGVEVVLASGTGTTAAGIASALDARHSLHIVNVLPQNEDFAVQLHRQIEALNPEAKARFEISNAHHLGSYAKFDAQTAALIDFAQQHWQLPLEPIYTAKAFARVVSLLARGGTRPVVFIHTGGLQGLRGCQAKLDTLRGKAEYQTHLARYQNLTINPDQAAAMDAEEGVLCPI